MIRCSTVNDTSGETYTLGTETNPTKT